MLVLIFGPLLALIPIHIVQFVVGVLLILFGMRCLLGRYGELASPM